MTTVSIFILTVIAELIVVWIKAPRFNAPRSKKL